MNYKDIMAHATVIASQDDSSTVLTRLVTEKVVVELAPEEVQGQQNKKKFELTVSVPPSNHIVFKSLEGEIVLYAFAEDDQQVDEHRLAVVNRLADMNLPYLWINSPLPIQQQEQEKVDDDGVGAGALDGQFPRRESIVDLVDDDDSLLAIHAELQSTPTNPWKGKGPLRTSSHSHHLTSSTHSRHSAPRSPYAASSSVMANPTFASLSPDVNSNNNNLRHSVRATYAASPITPTYAQSSPDPNNNNNNDNMTFTHVPTPEEVAYYQHLTAMHLKKQQELAEKNVFGDDDQDDDYDFIDEANKRRLRSPIPLKDLSSAQQGTTPPDDTGKRTKRREWTKALGIGMAFGGLWGLTNAGLYVVPGLVSTVLAAICVPMVFGFMAYGINKKIELDAYKAAHPGERIPLDVLARIDDRSVNLAGQLIAATVFSYLMVYLTKTFLSTDFISGVMVAGVPIQAQFLFMAIGAVGYSAGLVVSKILTEGWRNQTSRGLWVTAGVGLLGGAVMHLAPLFPTFNSTFNWSMPHWDSVLTAALTQFVAMTLTLKTWFYFSPNHKHDTQLTDFQELPSDPDNKRGDLPPATVTPRSILRNTAVASPSANTKTFHKTRILEVDPAAQSGANAGGGDDQLPLNPAAQLGENGSGGDHQLPQGTGPLDVATTFIKKKGNNQVIPLNLSDSDSPFYDSRSWHGGSAIHGSRSENDLIVNPMTTIQLSDLRAALAPSAPPLTSGEAPDTSITNPGSNSVSLIKPSDSSSDDEGTRFPALLFSPALGKRHSPLQPIDDGATTVEQVVADSEDTIKSSSTVSPTSPPPRVPSPTN